MAEAIVRLACVRHAASVRSEPESNSQVDVHSNRRGKPTIQSSISRSRSCTIFKWNLHIETYRNGLNLTDHTQPESLHRPEPPPTCPFINPTMRKNRNTLYPQTKAWRTIAITIFRGTEANREIQLAAAGEKGSRRLSTNGQPTFLQNMSHSKSSPILRDIRHRQPLMEWRNRSAASHSAIRSPDRTARWHRSGTAL